MMYTSRGETCRTECYPDEGIVIKKFVPRKKKFGAPIDQLRGSLDLSFYRECTCLERLQDSNRFPKLIEANEKDLTVKMSWVGMPFLHHALDNKERYIKHADDIIDTLIKKNIKLAYEWKPDDQKIGYCLSMMMVNGNDLNLIDFERAWPVGCDRENEFNDLFKDSFKHHCNEKFRKILKETIITTTVKRL